MTSVAFIGLGNMGSGMAQRLLKAGHDLRAYNRTRSKGTDLEHAGAQRCLTPREACGGAEAVIAMTADDTSSRAVWLGRTVCWRLSSLLEPWRSNAQPCRTIG